MKPILASAFVVVISAFSYAALSQDRQTPMASQDQAQKANASMLAKMVKCFRRHGHLMVG